MHCRIVSSWTMLTHWQCFNVCASQESRCMQCCWRRGSLFWHWAGPCFVKHWNMLHIALYLPSFAFSIAYFSIWHYWSALEGLKKGWERVLRILLSLFLIRLPVYLRDAPKCCQDYPWLSTRPGGCKCFEYVRKHGFRACAHSKSCQSPPMGILRFIFGEVPAKAQAEEQLPTGWILNLFPLQEVYLLDIKILWYCHDMIWFASNSCKLLFVQSDFAKLKALSAIEALESLLDCVSSGC